MQHKKELRTHQATLTDREARIINFFRTNHPGEIQSDFLFLFEMVTFNFPDAEEWKGFKSHLYGVWALINAIEPIGALDREELDNNPEKLHI